MHALVLASILQVAGAAQVPSVLIIPLVNKEGVSRDLADQISTMLSHVASSLDGFRITNAAEMSVDQLQLALSCDQVSCAAELAGVLNADQVVIGSLGRIGGEYVLSLTRIKSRTAKRLGSVLERVPVKPESALLDRVTAAVPRLFGISAAKAKSQEVSDTKEEEPEADQDEPARSPLPWLLRGVGIVGTIGAFPPLLLGGLLGVVAGSMVCLLYTSPSPRD